MPEVTHHQKSQLLDVLFHYMDPDLRRKVMAEVPLAYNAYVGSKVVKVVHADDVEREYTV